MLSPESGSISLWKSGGVFLGGWSHKRNPSPSQMRMLKVTISFTISCLLATEEYKAAL